MILNILITRYILMNYKNILIDIVTKISFNKLNINNLVNNVLKNNIKYYNILIKFNIFLIISSKSLCVFLGLWLYNDMPSRIVSHMVHYKLNNIHLLVSNQSISADYINNYSTSIIELLIIC